MTLTATIHDDGSGTLTGHGLDPQHVPAGDDLEATRAALLQLVQQQAKAVGQTIRVDAVEPDHTWPLAVSPDGFVTDVSATPDVDETPDVDQTPPAAPSAPSPSTSVPAAVVVKDDPSLMTRREARERSFLTSARPEEPASAGWRGFLAGLGFKVGPSPEETSRRNDVRAVSRHWAGPRTIAVVNGKGGASKTPSTAMLAAVFARYGGGGVLAWDNNDTRGTPRLAYRAGPARVPRARPAPPRRPPHGPRCPSG